MSLVGSARPDNARSGDPPPPPLPEHPPQQTIMHTQQQVNPPDRPAWLATVRASFFVGIGFKGACFGSPPFPPPHWGISTRAGVVGLPRVWLWRTSSSHGEGCGRAGADAPLTGEFSAVEADLL